MSLVDLDFRISRNIHPGLGILNNEKILRITRCITALEK